MIRFVCCLEWYVNVVFLFLFFNDTATTEIDTLSLHDALPICVSVHRPVPLAHRRGEHLLLEGDRSEEHTSELQSPYVISYAVFCLNTTTHQPSHRATTMSLHLRLFGGGQSWH